MRSSTFYFASLREISSNPLEIDILVGSQAVVVWLVGRLVGRLVCIGSKGGGWVPAPAPVGQIIPKE